MAAKRKSPTPRPKPKRIKVAAGNGGRKPRRAPQAGGSVKRSPNGQFA